jgi:hypothetical protein
VQNIAVVAEDKFGDRRNQTLAVGATDQQHCGRATGNSGQGSLIHSNLQG